MDIFQSSLNIKERLIAHRRYLHQCPEIGFALEKTTAYIINELKILGYEPQIIGDHGIYAMVGHGHPCLLLRADMDALPMAEKSGLPFASTDPQAAHCCGHDTHMAMLLGAAELLKAYESQLKGSIKLFFQPAEEPCLGGHAMVEAGILEGVDAAVGMHSVADHPTGHIFFKPGIQTASSDFFSITIKGHSCHGSAPHKGVDPIVIASHLILNLQNLNAREVDASERFTLTFGKLQAGTMGNIIADEAVLEGSIRAFDQNVRQLVKQRFIDITQATAAMFNGTADIHFGICASNVVNDQRMIDIIAPALKKELGDDHVDDHKGPLSFSEDYSYISEKVPSLFILNGAQPKGADPLPLHDAHIIFDEEALVTGTAAYVTAALAYLNKKS